MYKFIRMTPQTKLNQETRNYEETGKLIALFQTDDIYQVMSILPKPESGQKKYSNFDTEIYRVVGTIDEIEKLKNFVE